MLDLRAIADPRPFSHPEATALPQTITITIPAADADAFRSMLREQLVGDHELVREVLAERQPSGRLPAAFGRIMLVEDLARQVGGLYGSELGPEPAAGRGAEPSP